MSEKRDSISIKFVALFVLFVVVALVFVVRVFHLSSQHEYYEELRRRQSLDSITVLANRGNIYACNGELLATSIPYYRLHLDFCMFERPSDKKNKNWTTNRAKYEKSFYDNLDSLALTLSQVIGDKTKEQYKSELKKNFEKKKKNGSHNSYYLVSSKKISELQLNEILKTPFFRSNNSGLLLDDKTIVRAKPFGILAAKTIGDITTVDTTDTRGRKFKQFTGFYGLEYTFEDDLKGTNGICHNRRYRKARKNGVVSVNDIEPIDGMDIVTTIDINAQDVAETELMKMLEHTKADMGCAVVMEVETGEIKAIANLSRNKSDGKYYEWENVAYTKAINPGSTFKTASIMVALENGLVQPDDVFNTTTSGIWRYRNTKAGVKDSHYKENGSGYGYGNLTVSQIIAKSSNIGTAKIIDSFYYKNPKEFTDAIYDLGFLTKRDFDIASDVTPYIKTPTDENKKNGTWDNTSLAWLSFGYNSKIPPIYTLMFYNAIANDGKMVKPFLVKKIIKNGHVEKEFETETLNSAICSKSTLNKLRPMLEAVVNDSIGTGNRHVRSKIVNIAGKTGTAQIQNGGHHLSFCGYFPAENPKYTCIVSIINPKLGKDQMGGGPFCGPVFKAIAEKLYVNFTRTNTDTIKNCTELPYAKDGNYKKMHAVLSDLDIDTNGNKGETGYVHTKTDSTQIYIEQKNINDKYVPNVVGLGARDAIYLLEQRGLHVQIIGRGKVTQQSIMPGTNLNGQYITLTLK